MDYPSKPPSVYFLQPTPRHEHVYTNGDICLNLLGRDWRPNMSASTLALSILSMLSSAKEKKIPQDNHVRKCNAHDGLWPCLYLGKRGGDGWVDQLVLCCRSSEINPTFAF